MKKEVEEAINVVKNDIYDLKGFLTESEKIKWQKAIETVLNYIKRLEAKIKRYEKYLDNKDKKFKEALEYEYQERETDYISKEVIRDKIEEIKLNIKESKDVLYGAENIVSVLNELLEEK